jgi:hypothetical protein
MFDIFETGVIVIFVLGVLVTRLFVDTQYNRKRNNKRDNSDDSFDLTDYYDSDDGGTDIDFGD